MDYTEKKIWPYKIFKHVQSYSRMKYPHSQEWHKSKSLTIYSIGEYEENWAFSHVRGGDVKWHNLRGKEFGNL